MEMSTNGSKRFVFLAQDLLGVMEAAGRTTMSASAFNAAISACEKGGQWLLALHLLDCMLNSNVQPGIVPYNAAISACESQCTKCFPSSLP